MHKIESVTLPIWLSFAGHLIVTLLIYLLTSKAKEFFSLVLKWNTENINLHPHPPPKWGTKVLVRVEGCV